jgi:heterodisulfide reductase subunit A
MPSMHEKKENQDEPKVGVYICHCGGNISDHVDVHQLAESLQAQPNVTVTHTNMFMCSDPGQELIQQDIKSGKINRVVVASCAPSLHELTFRSAIKRTGMNPYLYEHANIREQVSWVHDGEKATQKAAGLISAAISKSKHLEALEPIRVDAVNHATIIGGGVAGLRAAMLRWLKSRRFWEDRRPVWTVSIPPAKRPQNWSRAWRLRFVRTRASRCSLVPR